MSRKTPASVFGGAGGRGSRASVSTLDGLRNVLRNEPDAIIRDPAPPRSAAAAASPAAAKAAADDKRTMRGLNERLSGYLDRVKHLEKDNRDLEEQIEDILSKRGAPDGRDWDEIEKPLAALREKVKDKTLENAKLLLQLDNIKLADDDFKSKLDAEKKARRAIEQDLLGMKKTIDDTQMNRMQLENQIESVKEEMANLKEDHKQDVAELRDKIMDSNVDVQMDSQDSNLGEMLNKTREQYEKLAKRNLREMEDWYSSKFDNIRVEVAQNTEALQSGKTELTELNRQRLQVEVDIQAMLSRIHSLEDTLKDTERRYGNELKRLNQKVLALEAELSQVRDQVERQRDDYQDLLYVKMKLEAEIGNYQRLLHGTLPEEERMPRA
ncbi:keratin, type I cytoskeletal 18 isoform X2 [Genypterus blacodes]|uniref:keratin, type I cytoskeletal 18 isoform X2 n=1 Tax=Genypterus blacodes TaxID=154954 RepID=UPI003F7764FD